MAKRPDRTCPVTGLPAPYKGFGRPSVYHETVTRKRPYEYSLEELEIIATAREILRDARSHPMVIAAAVIHERAGVYQRLFNKNGKTRPYTKSGQPRKPRKCALIPKQ